MESPCAPFHLLKVPVVPHLIKIVLAALSQHHLAATTPLSASRLERISFGCFGEIRAGWCRCTRRYTRRCQWTAQSPHPTVHESLIKPANASQKSSSPWPLATTASRRTHAQTAGAWANASYRTDWTNQQGFPHHSVSVRNVKKGPTVPPRGAPGMCEKMAVIVVAPPQAKSQRWPIAAAAGGRLWERPAWQCWHHTQEITGGCVPLHLLVSSAFPAPKLCKPEPVSPPCSLFG